MAYPYKLGFRKSITVMEKGSDPRITNATGTGLRLKDPTPGLRDLVTALVETGHSADDLYERFVAREGAERSARFWYYLQRFDDSGWICRSVMLEGRHLCTLTPISHGFRFREEAMNPDAVYVLSRFAYCRNQDGRLVLESPLGHGRLELDGRGAALLAELSTPASISGICERLRTGETGGVGAFFNLLWNAGVLEGSAPAIGVGNAGRTALKQWEFHDLLFHARSRQGRHDTPLGGTYRFIHEIEPLPAIKPKMSGERTALYRPDLDTIQTQDPPFARVLETRRSIRDYSLNPLTLEQLGEFLFRSYRVRSFQDRDPDRGHLYQTTNRPCPGGGAIYELELYPVVNECDGAASGLYHYDPSTHELCRLSGSTKETKKLLDDACMASGLQYEPGILFVITSRFQRVSWKYESMAYALILKDVGILYQTMYLVATAMGLAPCAIGSGDSDLFARAAGLDYFEESSVGEFLLGTRQA